MDRPRRIVITRRARLDFRDGINIFIFSLADALIQAGHEVAVVATTVGDRSRIGQLFGTRAEPTLEAIEEAPRRLHYEGLTVGWLLHGARIIGRHEPDLVINNGALPFRVPGRSCNVAHDLGWSRRRLDRLRRAYKRFAYGRCDHIVALCTEIREGLAGQLDVPVATVSVIPPCVDVEATEFAARPTREDAVLHTGTEDYKSPATTVRAFAAMSRPSTRLYIEGEAGDELRRQVLALPAATRSRIELLGALDAARLRQLLGSVRVASFPTRYAVPTASPTVVEAIAAGTPIAGSTLLSRDLLEHEGNGLACRNERELSAAFERLLGDDDWASMSGRAREMAPRFSARTVARRYLSLIDPGLRDG
jgi:glycosyltransferase involved in cell wall biosynthesis